MGGVSVDTGKGGKRSVDFNVNLVPFIDFLSVLIAFLMITAVWTQVARLQVAQSGGQSESDEPPKPTLTLNLTVNDRGFILSAGGAQIELPKKDEAYDVKGLFDKLAVVKKENPEHTTITVAADDQVVYEDLVRTVDVCIEVGLPDVTVTATS